MCLELEGEFLLIQYTFFYSFEESWIEYALYGESWCSWILEVFMELGMVDHKRC